MSQSAFPHPSVPESWEPYTEAIGASSGMSLRDYFAAKVEIDPDMSIKTAEILVGRAAPPFAAFPIENMKFWAEACAKLRYMQADAMLTERAK